MAAIKVYVYILYNIIVFIYIYIYLYLWWFLKDPPYKISKGSYFSWLMGGQEQWVTRWIMVELFDRSSEF